MHHQSLPIFVYKKFPYFKKIFENHAYLHHRKYYHKFNYEPDPYGRDLDIKLDTKTTSILAVPVSLAIWFLISPTFAIIFFLMFIVHQLLWNAIHSEMHRPKQTWFSKMRIYKYLARNHWMHHTYPGKNFNVVFPPIADLVMQTHLSPSARDIEKMKADGI